MSKLAKALTAAAGNAGESLYVEDVFSTYLYEGIYTASVTSQTITNNIDLAGEGGLVWFKNRTSAANHRLIDTERGGNLTLISNSTGGNSNLGSNGITSFNSNGWTMGTASLSYPNGNDFCSWTFRKAEKFFDVVTYTGNGLTTVSVNHSLGVTPGMIIVKRVSNSADWYVWHKDLGTWEGGLNALLLNSTDAEFSGGFSSVSDTNFVMRDGFDVNASGDTYVAYLFASDAGGFGDDGSENIIKCGSYTGTGGAGTPPVIDLGFEPQWLLVKNANDAGGNWMLMDTMRGWGSDGSNLGPKNLRPNTSDSEFDWGQYNYDLWTVNPTGFTVGPTDLYNVNNTTGATYIYIAIRRPMKTPESGTEVFNPFIYTGNNVGGRALGSLSGADSILASSRNTSDSIYPNWQSKLQGNSTRLVTSDNGSEYTSASFCYSFGNIQDGVTVSGSDMNGSGKTYVAYEFKRATGFFDVVAYTGNGTPSNTVRRDLKHNLGVAPELAILKRRDTTSEWQVAADGKALYLNLTNSSVGTYTPSSYFNATDFDVEGWVSEPNNNVSGSNYIVYLFATLAGVSKVGSYTGDGTTDGSNVIDCGFSAGARFVLIKRTDSSGSWLYMDSVRGITTSNDPILKLNSSGTEQLGNSVHPAASGFGVVEAGGSNANTSGANYIFLAIA